MTTSTNLILSDLSDKELKQEALRLCKEFLGAPWNEIAISDFKFSTVSGGFSNSLYYCSLPDNIKIDNPKSPKQVLLRIYGPLQEVEHVVVVETTTFMLLSERQLGPKLYGIFPKGRLEEYIPSRSLKTDDLRQMSTAIAREMAKIHSLNIPVRKVPTLFLYTDNWLQDIENETIRKYGKSFDLGDFYRKELDWLTKEMEQTKSPIVYCHNDLQGGNILLRHDSINEKEPNLILIDFEFGCYNYRGFDIANHFCEWAFDYNTPEPPHFVYHSTKYPTKEEQVEFITAYLNQLVLEGCLKSSAVSIEASKIFEELKLFGMAPQLFWSLWGYKMRFESDLDFCHTIHSEHRQNLYEKLKEKYLKMKSRHCNGDQKN